MVSTPAAMLFAHCQSRPLPDSAQTPGAPTSGQFSYLPTFVIGALRTMCASLRVTFFAFASDLIWSSLTSKTGVTPGLSETELNVWFSNSPTCAGLSACAEGERSFESAQLRHGIWRHHLIEAFTGKTRTGVNKDGTLTAAGLHTFLTDAVPRTLRRAYETPQDQTPLLFGEANAGALVAELAELLGPGGDVLDPSRMRRVVFRAESVGNVKELAGFRKTHSLPERANEWARKYVNRIAQPDIKADLDNTFDAVREQFGYKRKDLDVSAERDGLGFIRTPDFEYTVTVEVNPDDPTEVIWRQCKLICRNCGTILKSCADL